MGSRYLVTGAQLGMIKGFSKVNKIDEIEELIEEILFKNYIGTSNKTIEEDVLKFTLRRTNETNIKRSNTR